MFKFKLPIIGIALALMLSHNSHALKDCEVECIPGPTDDINLACSFDPDCLELEDEDEDSEQVIIILPSPGGSSGDGGSGGQGAGQGSGNGGEKTASRTMRSQANKDGKKKRKGNNKNKKKAARQKGGLGQWITAGITGVLKKLSLSGELDVTITTEYYPNGQIKKQTKTRKGCITIGTGTDCSISQLVTTDYGKLVLYVTYYSKNLPKPLGFTFVADSMDEFSRIADDISAEVRNSCPKAKMLNGDRKLVSSKCVSANIDRNTYRTCSRGNIKFTYENVQVDGPGRVCNDDNPEF